MPKQPVVRAVAAAAVLLCTSQAARAALVTFDDLPWVPSTSPGSSFADRPITSQYESLGLRVEGGYLDRLDESPSDQFMLGDIFLTISFVSAALPNYVSLNLSSPYAPMKTDVQAWSGNTLVGEGTTGGDYFDGSQDPPIVQDEPYRHDGLVSFASASGISRLTFGNATGGRFSALVDNIYFGAVPAVPEPSALWLALAGAPWLMVAARRRRQLRR